MLANEIAEPSPVRWIAGEMEADETFEFITLVDSAITIAMIEATLEGVLRSRTLPVLIEIGPTNGRGGVRDVEHALELARLVLRSDCYLTHDLGEYHEVSPFDGRRDQGEAPDC
ncbi:MAG: hypothetical protein WA860_13530 [Acidimicrobiales bacterium]